MIVSVESNGNCFLFVSRVHVQTRGYIPMLLILNNQWPDGATGGVSVRDVFGFSKRRLSDISSKTPTNDTDMGKV